MTNIHENVTKKYFTNFPRVEPVEINSSRLRDYKTCPELYRLKHVLGYKPTESPVYWAWGRSIHKFMETLEREFATGKWSVEAVVGVATIAAMQEWGDTKDPPVEDKKFGFMTKSRLSDLLIFISKLWLQEKSAGNIKIIGGTEKTFTLQLAIGHWITGTPDQPVVEWAKSLYVRDFKSTTVDLKYYARQLYPNDQFARYLFAEQKLTGKEFAGVLVDVFFMTRDKGPTHKREVISYSKESLKRWEDDQTFWKHALDYSRENDSYPQNENFCKWCPFHEVCKCQSQMAKEYTLKTKYKFEPSDNVREGSTILEV